MTGDEIRLDRYAKFRKLGMFEEFLVPGGRWREARAARAAAPGARTKAGTWAPTEDEAALVEALADADEAWAERLRGKDEWVHKPSQPPGLLRSGVMEATLAMAELARAQGGGRARGPGRGREARGAGGRGCAGRVKRERERKRLSGRGEGEEREKREK